MRRIESNKYDFIIDAIDTITSKIYLCEYSINNNLNIISSMGTGNRLDPLKFEITDLFKTSYDPVAKVMRYELRKKGIKRLTVLASKEIPLIPKELINDSNKRQTPASISFVPSTAGLIIASYVIKELIK